MAQVWVLRLFEGLLRLYVISFKVISPASGGAPQIITANGQQFILQAIPQQSSLQTSGQVLYLRFSNITLWASIFIASLLLLLHRS